MAYVKNTNLGATEVATTEMRDTSSEKPSFLAQISILKVPKFLV